MAASETVIRNASSTQALSKSLLTLRRSRLQSSSSPGTPTLSSQGSRLAVLTGLVSPFKRFGLIPVGGRSTAIKLESGDVWVLASTALCDETRAKLDEMGPVKYACSISTDSSL